MAALAKILFVDDDALVLQGYRRVYRKQFDVRIAEGGQQGLEVLQHEEFSVVVSDMLIPEMDGLQFPERVE